MTKHAILHRKSDTHYVAESSTYGPMVTYNLRAGEHGWTCECQGYAHNHDCYHLKHLYDILGLSPILIPARIAVKTLPPLNKGDALVALFDYGPPDTVRDSPFDTHYPAPPTHTVTNRSKVAGHR